MKKLIVIIFLLLATKAYGAGPFFIDFDTGSDSDDGLTAGNAWLTEAYDFTVWGRDPNGIRSLVPRETTITTEASSLDLIAHYTMDDAADQTTVLDSSGNNLHGTSVNNVRSVTGQIDTAIDFNGIDDYVSIGDTPTFDLSPSMTVTCWSKNNNSSVTDHESLVSKYSRADDKREWHWSIIADDKPHLFVSVDGTFDAGKFWQVSADDAVTINEWHYYTFTFDSGTILFYVDGIAVDITVELEPSPPATTFNEGTASLQIGAAYLNFTEGTADRFWDGAIDDIRIYNTVLTGEEILALFQGVEEDRTGRGRYSPTGSSRDRY